jgi:hypothetical protein
MVPLHCAFGLFFRGITITEHGDHPTERGKHIYPLQLEHDMVEHSQLTGSVCNSSKRGQKGSNFTTWPMPESNERHLLSSPERMSQKSVLGYKPR